MTAKFTNPLENIKIASPCSQDWNEMIGTDRKRFCGECKLNVYNLSDMSRAEAENLLNSEGRLCVRYYKRADGTVLTKDCPVGWQAIKRRASRISAAAASLIFGVIGGLGFTTNFNQSENGETGRLISVLKTPKPTPSPIALTGSPMPLTGMVAIPSPTLKATPKPKASPTQGEFRMGDVAMPAPTPKATPSPKDTEVLMGKVKISRD